MLRDQYLDWLARCHYPATGSAICNFSLSVSARRRVEADVPQRYTFHAAGRGREPGNKQIAGTSVPTDLCYLQVLVSPGLGVSTVLVVLHMHHSSLMPAFMIFIRLLVCGRMTDFCGGCIYVAEYVAMLLSVYSVFCGQYTTPCLLLGCLR